MRIVDQLRSLAWELQSEGVHESIDPGTVICNEAADVIEAQSAYAEQLEGPAHEALGILKGIGSMGNTLAQACADRLDAALAKNSRRENDVEAGSDTARPRTESALF